MGLSSLLGLVLCLLHEAEDEEVSEGKQNADCHERQRVSGLRPAGMASGQTMQSTNRIAAIARMMPKRMPPSVSELPSFSSSAAS